MIYFLIGLFGMPIILIACFFLSPKVRQRQVIEAIHGLKCKLVGAKKWVNDKTLLLLFCVFVTIAVTALTAQSPPYANGCADGQTQEMTFIPFKEK